MTATMQILMGSFVLGVCSTFHIVLLTYVIRFLKSLDGMLSERGYTAHWVVLMAAGFASVILAHTVQVWVWAVAFVALGALPQISDALYFSIVTYTTVGYGDVTLEEGFRIFGAMASVTGLLNFGLSTAFLVGLVGRLLPKF